MKAKSDDTRARIMDAALELFRREGFEATTMRDIAKKADVALGGAYYYFASKDAIVAAFYEQAQVEMEPMVARILSGTRDLQERLAGILNVKLKYFEPSRRLLTALSVHTNPEHALSPFSEETREIREKEIQSFQTALEESRTKAPDDLKPHLPRLLWMYQMGLLLFWLYDKSPGQRKTHVLLEKSLQIVVRLIKLSGVPLTRPLRRLVVELAETVTG